MSKVQDMILQEIAAKALVDKMKGNVNEVKIKLGDIVIAKAGPHKGVKHTVIHDYGDGKYNIQPIGLRPNKIQYKLGAASAKENELKFVKAGPKKPKTTTIDTSGMSKAQIAKALRAKRGLKDEGKLAEAYKSNINKRWKSAKDLESDLIQYVNDASDAGGPNLLKDIMKAMSKARDVALDKSMHREGKLNEAPMDKRFAKEYEKSSRALINHIKSELSKGPKGQTRAQLQLYAKEIAKAMEVPSKLAKLVGMNESTKAYGDALKAMERERTAASLSKKDKDTLLKLADLMKKHGMVKEANVNPKFKKAIHKFVASIAKKYDIPPTSVIHTIKSVLDERKQENVAPDHDGKAAPYGSGYDKIDEVEEDKLFPKKDKEDKDLKEKKIGK